MSPLNVFDPRTFTDEEDMAKFRRELGEEIYAYVCGVPRYGDMQYEYKDKLSDFDRENYTWERQGDDGLWYDKWDGYWAGDDFYDPSKPMLSHNEALKHRSPLSDLYDIDYDPKYTPEERARIKQERAERIDQETDEFFNVMLAASLICIALMWFIFG